MMPNGYTMKLESFLKPSVANIFKEHPQAAQFPSSTCTSSLGSTLRGVK